MNNAKRANVPIVLPALGAHGLDPHREFLPHRLSKACPFPAAATTQEILAIATAIREAGYKIVSPEQHDIVLRAPKQGENAVVVGVDGDGVETFFEARNAAIKKAQSKLWFCAADYPFAPSWDEQKKRDKLEFELIEAALAARQNAYAPYSNYQVGAAILTEAGNLVTGCNVENASYGLCNCAERTAIFRAIAQEGNQMRINICVVATDDGGTPCGACRQVLAEFTPEGGAALLRVLLVDKTGQIVHDTTLAELLPMAFTLR